MRAKAKSVRNIIAASLLGCLVILMLMPAPRAFDFPREGATGIPNGVAAPFAGKWWLGFPEGDGFINGAPLVDCASAVELIPNGADRLLYRSSADVEIEFELMAFSGRTTWLPKWGESSIAVWLNADEFFIYSVDLTTGKARWDSPKVFRRC
ncbi:hypothetical protein GCM10007989_27210 [Devosia pacifica]|uniref:Uncharacterized protein n=1 Tax=Devosia pacifica TaxID=1335967 RepID=A0A918S9F6_9HYPH|nr:hypothetical protein [Devosia pacifica]GHA30092.1 hypothetical protein GCM10007989_27210 [Devosia pacifica]